MELMGKVEAKEKMKISVHGNNSGHFMLSAVIILFLVLLIIFAVLAKTSYELKQVKEEKTNLEKMIEEKNR